MSHNLLLMMDWSNIDRGQREMGYKIGQYDKEAGFAKLKKWLSEIGTVTKLEAYTPFHDIYGHFEFLRDRGFTIVLCPIVAYTLADTTDQIMITNALDYIHNYNMEYFILGSGDGRAFVPVLIEAKKKGIKVGVVYGSDISLSSELYRLVDVYPEGHEKAGKPMLHLFSPTSPNTDDQKATQ